MTAEVCVMNRIGVALAADSAVTLSPNGKIYTSADKLFALSEVAPVGVMVYGNASFTEIPWETMIKVFRRGLGKDRFPTLHEYAENLIAFLQEQANIVSEEMQRQCAKMLVADFLYSFRERIGYEINMLVAQAGNIPEDEIEDVVEKLVKQLISEEMANARESGRLADLPPDFTDVLRTEYGELINNEIADTLGNLPGVPANNELYELVIEVLMSQYGSLVNTGLVTAGFGEDEIFPQLIEYQIDGMIAGRLLYCKRRLATVSLDTRAWIIPFAQQEMVHTFMEGIDPFLLDLFEHATFDVLRGMAEILIEEFRPIQKRNDKALIDKVNEAVINMHADLITKFKQKRSSDYNAPVMRIVAALPKDELAAMAESLVNLTKFKRRVSQQMETVGGPIDVAVISKGDGFVWIKRKHYFDAALNPRFVARYQKEG